MAYIGQAPSTIVSENTFDEFNFTATSNQTTFTGVDSDGKTLVYNPGNLEVFLNGVRLEEADFTATNGTSVVLTTGASTNDVMSVKSFTVFEFCLLIDAQPPFIYYGLVHNFNFFRFSKIHKLDYVPWTLATL